MWEPGEGEDEAVRQSKINAAAQKLVERFKGQGFVALEAATWPQGKAEMSLAGGDLRITWSKFRLSVSGPRLPQSTSRAVKHMKQWKPFPNRVFFRPDIVVVEIEHDPGEAYSTDGLNVNHTFEPITLSASPKDK